MTRLKNRTEEGFSAKTVKDNFIIFCIDGGVGKNILATAVVEGLSKKFPGWNIVVLTGWRDVWRFNPHVYRAYNWNNAPYFYSSYIQGKRVHIFRQEPYQTEAYLMKKEHLIKTWFDLCGLVYNNELPRLYFNSREIEFVSNTITRHDPIFVLQTNGGAPTDVKYSWMRDLPISVAQKVVDEFRGEARIIHLRREDQLALDGVETFMGSIRELCAVISQSHYRLFIDSMGQHAAAALELPSTVCWVRNLPEVLGYSMHSNIRTPLLDELDSLDFSILEPYDISGPVIQCPFSVGSQVFDAEEIIESVRRNHTPFSSGL